MSASIGELAVRIGANTDDLMAGISKSRTALKDLAGTARTGATEFAKYGAAATAAGAALAAAMVVNSAEAAKEIKNLSNIANTSLGTFQKMAFGAKSVGIEQDKLSDILKDFNDRVGDFNATGGGPMVDFFEKIAPKVGVTAEQFKNLSGDQSLQLYVDSLEKANLSQADMVFYMEAMASDSTALLPLLKNNGKALAEQAKRAEELGLAMSDLDVNSLVDLNKQLSSAGGVVSSLAEQFSAKLAPTITVTLKAIEDMVAELGGVDDIAGTAFNGAIEAGAFLVDAVEGVKRTFEVLGKTGVLVGLGLTEMFLMVSDFAVNRPIEAINELIAALNMLPSVDIEPVALSELGETILNDLGMVRNAIDIGLQDIDEVLQRPMPGDTFKRYVASANEAALQAAEALNAGKQAEFDSMVEWGEIIDEELRTQREQQLEAGALEQQAWSDLIAEGERERFEILRESLGKQRILEAAEAANRKAALGDVLDNLASLMGSKSRKMFEIGKVAAIANTIVSTMQGAQNAYTALSSIPVVGPALGAAAAAAAIAAGAVRVQAINAQSFSKGSVSGAAAGATSQNLGNQIASGQQAPSQIQYVQGINSNDLFSGAQIIDLINNAQEQGARLVLL